MQKPLKGNVSISRPSCSDGREIIRIQVTDELSRERFLTIEMSPQDMMTALTGLAFQPAKLYVDGLEYVGKKREYQKASVTVDAKHLENSYDRKCVKEYILKHHQLEGWKMDTYLDSRSSINRVEGQVRINFGYYRFVEVTE